MIRPLLNLSAGGNSVRLELGQNNNKECHTFRIYPYSVVKYIFFVKLTLIQIKLDINQCQKDKLVL